MTTALSIRQAVVALAMHSSGANLLMGAELQWARRENNSDGWHTDGHRLQFSLRYGFSKSM